MFFLVNQAGANPRFVAGMQADYLCFFVCSNLINFYSRDEQGWQAVCPVYIYFLRYG